MHRNDPGVGQGQIALDQSLDHLELGRLARQQDDVGIVLDDPPAEVEEEVLEDPADQVLERGGVVAELHLQLHVDLPDPELVIDDALERIDHVGGDDVEVRVGDRLVRVGDRPLEVGDGQGDEQAVDPVHPVDPQPAVGHLFRAEQEVELVQVQADGAAELGDDDPLEHPLDHLVARHGHAVAVEDFAVDAAMGRADVVGIFGDHQVRGPAADVDAGDPDLGLIRAAPVGADPVSAGDGEPEVGAEVDQLELAPDVRQVDGAGLVHRQVGRDRPALRSAGGHVEDLAGFLRLQFQPLTLRGDHPAGEAQAQARQPTEPARVAHPAAVAHRVDQGVRLADHLVEGRGHQGAWGELRRRRRRGILALLVHGPVPSTLSSSWGEKYFSSPPWSIATC